MTGTRPTAINCTQCGAGLDVLGGGRVRRHVCPYCSAELDAQDNYRVLRRYRNLQRPGSPLKIGMTGEVDGVAVTVIGTIGMVEHHGGETWSWVNHQVYSPTHGYAWLTWEENRLVFTRKSRHRPRPGRLSAAAIENAETRPSFRHQGRKFRYYGSGIARMSFVEGEFNFAPRIGSESFYVSALGEDTMLTVREGAARTRGEIEYEVSSLPDQEALIESFGIDRSAMPDRRGVHPLEPFKRSRLVSFTRNTAIVAALASLVLSFVLEEPSTIHRADRLSVEAPYEGRFRVSQPDQLVEIEVFANLDNSWAFFEGEITDAEDDSVAAFSHEIGFYYGVERGERWSEGSQWGSVLLKLPAGTYDFSFAMQEAGTWRSGNVPTRMSVVVREGLIAWWWLIVGAVAMGGIAVPLLFQRMLHNSRRWSGSDWTDEDD